MPMLRRATVKGFKSLKDVTLELGPLNVLVGANGAGKSNLVAFFHMLHEVAAGRLQPFVATSGRAHSLLHDGAKATPQLQALLEFDTDAGGVNYSVRLQYAAGDTLVFAEETLTFTAFRPRGVAFRPNVVSLGAGYQESRLADAAGRDEPGARVLYRLLDGCRVYHFHDTSPTARVRQYGYVGDDRPLRPDAGNLAAVLYRLRRQHGPAYHRIVSTVGQVAPFFADFVLQPTGPDSREVILNWRPRGSDAVFGPHQLSDGTLRAMALITLLMQPEDDLPNLMVIDEPELGLHPYALKVIASLIQVAADHTQVVLGTQSSALLDEFAPADVIVVDRDDRATSFRRLDPPALASWLEDYSLGEVWEKNVMGGGPH